MEDSSLVLTGPLVSLQADSELVCGHGEHAGSVVGAERGESGGNINGNIGGKRVFVVIVTVYILIGWLVSEAFDFIPGIFVKANIFFTHL